MRKRDEPQRMYTQDERRALMRLLRKDAQRAEALHKHDPETQRWELRRSARNRGADLNPADEGLLLD